MSSGNDAKRASEQESRVLLYFRDPSDSLGEQSWYFERHYVGDNVRMWAKSSYKRWDVRLLYHDRSEVDMKRPVSDIAAKVSVDAPILVIGLREGCCQWLSRLWHDICVGHEVPPVTDADIAAAQADRTSIKPPPNAQRH